MYVAMIVLAGLISTMFVASVATSINELRRERENLREFARRHSAF
jgi:CHASE1-domain containing sensor protein